MSGEKKVGNRTLERRQNIIEVRTQLSSILETAGRKHFVRVIIKRNFYIELVDLEKQQQRISDRTLRNAYALEQEQPVLNGFGKL